MPHICFSESDQHWFRWWLVAHLGPSHYLNYSGLLPVEPLGTNFSEILIKIWFFINENASENIVLRKGSHLVQGDELISISKRNPCCLTPLHVKYEPFSQWWLGMDKTWEGTCNALMVATKPTMFFINSLTPRKFEWNFKYVIFKRILVIDGWCISSEIALIRMSFDLTDDKSTLVHVMAWCRQAASHYLNQCWPRSISPYGVDGPQWVNLKLVDYM